MAGHNSLELEIHHLFQEGYDLEAICLEVIGRYDKSDIISPSEIESVSHFLMTAGRIDLLFRFYLKGLRKKSLAIFPWGYFAEAVLQLAPAHESQSEFGISEELLDLIEAGLEQQTQEQSCFKSPLLTKTIPEVASRLEKLNNSFALKQLELKSQLMTQLNQHRLYQLVDQEEQTLLELIRIFPNDLEVKLLHQAHLEKKADDILSRIKFSTTPNQTSTARYKTEYQTAEAQKEIDDLSENLWLIAQQLQSSSPDQISHLALMAFQTELYELSLKIIELSPKNHSVDWLKAEILLESGRYLDLLNHIEALEKEPLTVDATFGSVYMKAQAYYGLGQKQMAINLLESLVQRSPFYRSTEALLHEWKNS